MRGNMKSRLEQKGQEAVYLLEYEKKKMEDCALSLDSLASAFLANTEKKEDQEDRQTFLWEKRMEENRQLFSGHLKEMAEVIKQTTRKDNSSGKKEGKADCPKFTVRGTGTGGFLSAGKE